MSDAARLAKQAFATKPNGTPYANFQVSAIALQSIAEQIAPTIVDTAFAAVVSYAEAMAGIPKGSSSWSVIRLYYSTFYALKALMLTHEVIPFNSGKEEMMLDARNNRFFKGGKSSHHWNWSSIRKTTIKHEWYASQDSEEAYEKLRKFRENVNYTHAFTDPKLHECLVPSRDDQSKRFRYYRDDKIFQYTYLIDHLAIAYPTKLIFEIDAKLQSLSYKLDPDRLKHLREIWKIRDRCPVT
jgi:uncharacterized protein (UPF0332 family)